MPDHAVRQNERLMARARALSRAASVIVAVAGALALVVSATGVDFFGGASGGSRIDARAAAALVLTGASLWLSVRPMGGAWNGRVGRTCALLAAVIGGVTLAEHLFGWNLGVDFALFRDEQGAEVSAGAGRAGSRTSFFFLVAGIALYLLHARGAALPVQIAAVATGLASLLALTGHAYSIDASYDAAPYTGIPLYMALALLVLSVGLLAAAPRRGVVSVITGSGAGSLMARRLLVFAITVPLLLGWVRIRLESSGFIDERAGIAILVLSFIVVFVALVLHTAKMLNDMEMRQIEAEARVRDRLHELETMMEVAPIGLFIATDPKADRIIGNRTAREFLRIAGPRDNLSLSAPADQAPVHFRILRDGVELSPEELPVQQAAKRGIPTHNAELDVIFGDGTVRHELISALPLLDQQGRPRGAVASLLDITARKVAEREREELLAREREARAQAEAANHAKDEFLATVSHELRTPLNAILGWVTMLRDGVPLDDAARERALATIERNCRAQAQLIEDLLDVSRIIAGKLRLETRQVDLVGIIRSAADVVRPAAEARNIRLRMVLDPSGSFVRGDPTRLQQVVWNLLTNAVKFSPRGSAVEVRLEREATDAVITVTDEGEGIDAAFLPHVFDRFRQADSKKTRRHGGLGLGLSIVRHLVEMHGGTIEALSDGVGRGSSFIVRLPLLESDVAQPPSADLESPAAEPSARQPLLGLRILAVDDEEDERDMLRAMLEGNGAEVVTASSAEEALAVFRGWQPDLVVSDLGMPDEDGYTFIELLRAFERDRPVQTPAIALTGYVSVEERVRALAAGYRMFVPKPVEPAELVALIESLTGQEEWDAGLFV